jgi:uncharacterized protein (DUF1499 family)
MKRPLIVGLVIAGGAALAGGIASAVLGSRPDGVGADGPLAPCGPALNCYRSRRALDAAPSEALDAAEAVLRDLRGLVVGRAVSVERTPEGVRAVVQSGPFRDDVTVAATPRGEDGGSTLYLRSASRVGNSDLGVNRLRGQHVLDAVAERLRADE